MVVATFGCTFWFDITRCIGYINKAQHNLYDTFLNMRQPTFMVLSQHVPNGPGRSTHTMCPERFEALLHVCQSGTLMSIDGTRHFSEADRHLCIQSARNIRTDCMSRPPTCTLHSHVDPACLAFAKFLQFSENGLHITSLMPMLVRLSSPPSHLPLVSSNTHLAYTVPFLPRTLTYPRLNRRIGYAALMTHTQVVISMAAHRLATFSLHMLQ
jgi:hypothetical protein